MVVRHVARRRASSRWSSSPTTRSTCAAQYHPEFISRPTRPEPLFREFVRAAVAQSGARAEAAAAQRGAA